MTHPTALAPLLARRAELLAYVERRLADRALAEDVLHDALARALPHLEGDAPPRELVPWFYQVLRTTMIDATRRRAARKRAAASFAAEPTVPTASAPEEAPPKTCQCVHGALEAIPPDYAALLRAVTMGGQALQDYAAAAGITSGNAGVRAHRARAALRAQVAKTCGACARAGCTDCSCTR
jgi:RNA polymerase sigma factor (sigma-70 family)